MIGSYLNGTLLLDGVPVDRIAETVGTPFYLYSSSEMTRAYTAYETALQGLGVRICYAMKANSNIAIIRHFDRLGAAMDVVSAGELERCLAAGIPGDRIVFSGVGKSEAEMAAALEAGIDQINVESPDELLVLSRVADSMGREAPIALRVNPDVDAKTHAKITTGRSENKFGIDIDQAPALYAKAAELPGIRPLGLAVHIGSQLLDLAPYRAAYSHLADLTRHLRGSGLPVERLDLGGGIGIAYADRPAPDLTEFAEIVRSSVSELGCHLTIEPGRSLVGRAGWLVTRVMYVKNGTSRRFVILDSAMNDLIRPAMYEALHEMIPVKQPVENPTRGSFDIVGPVCETGDTFARQYEMVVPSAGDLYAFADAGAYGAVMASEYNSRPLAPEVLAHDGEFSVIKKRPSLAERLAGEAIPQWLAGPVTP
ncbi:MAG: diaminopimelate decarboxylase [Pseudomonadota bacterium]